MTEHESQPVPSVRVSEAPLRYHDFRVLWLSSLFTGIGFVGETVVLGWLLLEETDSPFIVGAGVALRAFPNLILGIPGGAIADRFDRRLLLRLIGLASAAVTACLAALALAGDIAVWQVLLLTFAGGALRALGQSARQSYAFDVVGPGRVVGGMALLSLSQRVGGIAGSLGAGLVIEQSGVGEAYLAIAVLHLVSGAVMVLAHSAGQAAPSARPPVWQGVGEYARELRGNQLLATLVLLTAAVEILGFSHQAVMPSLARDTLDLGPEGLGLLSAFASVGGMAAILAISFRGELRHQGLTLLAVLLAFGAALILLGSGASLAVALAAIAVVAGLAALSDLLSQSLMQTAVANDLRGRAMGSWVLAIGLGPLGHLQIGAMAAAFGVSAALTVNGGLLMALALGTLVLARAIRRA